MKYITLLMVCLADFLLAHVDEIWKNADGYVQNIVFFSCVGLRFLLLFFYVLIIGTQFYKPTRGQLVGFSIYATFALLEYLLFVLGQL